MKTTHNSYSKGFLTRSVIVNGAGENNSIETTYTADAYGRIASMTTAAGTTTYEYNKNGRKVMEKDHNGNVTRYVYNDRNLLEEIILPDGSSKAFTYDNIGRKTAEWLEKGDDICAYTEYGYNALHQPTKISRQIDSGTYAETITSYNALGLPSRVSDPNGNVTKFEYDALGRLTKTTKVGDDNAGHDTTYVYGTNSGSNLFSTDGFKPTGVTNTLGYTSTYTYDKLYRTTQTSEQYAKNPAAYKTTSYTYDIFGNKTSETDSNGNTTTYTYNALDLPLKTSFADGNYTQNTYTAGGLLKSESDEMGNSTAYTYDSAGRLIKKTHPAAFNFDSGSSESPTEQFSYDAKGNLTRTIDPRGYATDYIYDSRDRVIFEIKPAVEYEGGYARPTVATAYDPAGNKTSVTDPMGNTTLFEYDMLGRVTKTTYPAVDTYNTGIYPDAYVEDIQNDDILTEECAYDKNGNMTEFTDKAGRVTTTEYNYLNKPISVKNNGTTVPETFKYDSEGNLLKITDRGGIVTNYTYDGLNRRTQAQYYATADTANQRFRNYTYDGLNLTQDSGLSYAYDTRNRLLETNDILTDSGHKFTYAYDPCSRIIGVAAVPESAGVSYSYDALGRIESESNNGKTHEYAYDLGGNRRYAQFGVENSGSSTHALNMEYDTNNRVVKIEGDDGKEVAYFYDLNGNVVEQRHWDATVTSRSYDAFNRIISSVTKKDGANLVSAEYRYDRAGNATYITQICGGKSQYLYNGYDALDRLRWESQNGIFNEYFYTGNAISSIDLGGSASVVKQFTYLQNSLLIANIYESSSSNNIDSPIFTYDSMGNVSRLCYGGATGDVNRYFTYDGYGRLVSAKEIDDNYTETPYAYSYDYRGRRLSYEKPSGATKYYYSDGVSIAETTGSNTTLFYRGPDMGGGVGGINYACNADGKSFNSKYYNLRGDVIVTTSEQGNVLSQSVYTAYGEHTDYGTPPADKHRANTKVEDTDTGLLNEGHRYRLLGYPFFISPDPLEYIDGHNFYAYCGYNPWGRFDPNGLAEEKNNDAGANIRNNRDILADALGVLDPAAAQAERNKRQERAKDIREAPSKAASEVADNVPYVGSVKSALELITGQDAITGEEISRKGAFLGVIAGLIGKGGAVKGELKSSLKNSKKAPSHVTDVLEHVKKKGSPPKGYKGGRVWENSNNSLPSHTPDGKTITYKEYDVNPKVKGQSRGGERVVVGSDGKSYYTNDHYKTFTEIK